MRGRPAGWTALADSLATSMRTSSCHTSAPEVALSSTFQIFTGFWLDDECEEFEEFEEFDGAGAWVLRTHSWRTVGSSSQARCAPRMTTPVAVKFEPEVKPFEGWSGPAGRCPTEKATFERATSEITTSAFACDVGETDWVVVVSMRSIQRCAYKGPSQNSLRVCEAPHVRHRCRRYKSKLRCSQDPPNENAQLSLCGLLAAGLFGS